MEEEEEFSSETESDTNIKKRASMEHADEEGEYEVDEEEEGGTMKKRKKRMKTKKRKKMGKKKKKMKKQ